MTLDEEIYRAQETDFHILSLIHKKSSESAGGRKYFNQRGKEVQSQVQEGKSPQEILEICTSRNQREMHEIKTSSFTEQMSFGVSIIYIIIIYSYTYLD